MFFLRFKKESNDNSIDNWLYPLYEWLKRTIEKIFIGYHQAKLKITDLSSRPYIPLKKLAILNVSYEKYIYFNNWSHYHHRNTKAIRKSEAQKHSEIKREIFL